MASRYEIHFGGQQLRTVAPASLSDQLRSALGASENAADDQLVSLVASLRSTLEAVAEGKAGSQEAVAALAALSES